MDEWTSYLDLRTGAVPHYRHDRFGDEREGWELSEEEADAGLAGGAFRRFKDELASHPRQRER